ncbi:MAG: AMP-binding protein [Candidatus Aminicenantes bacterium]|nr:AMP-binding protein [Candidatus Aminicenantes bacterium]
MGLYDFTFYDLIDRNAFCFRDREAWFDVDDNRTLTFFQFKKKVDCLACGLQKHGIQKGDRIGVLAKNSLEYFLVFGAAAALGAIVLPINWRLSENEVAYNLTDCGPKFLFMDEEYRVLIDRIKQDLPSINSFFCFAPPTGAFLGFESLMDNHGDFNSSEVSSSDGLVIIHTAAVAGRPRGALLSHGNLLLADLHFDHYLHLTPEDVYLNCIPLFHVGGLFMAATTFHAGALNVNMSRFDAAKAVAVIEEKKVTLTMVFTPMLSSIIEEHEKTGRDIRSLRSVNGIETPENIERYQKITGGTFWSMYGQTEVSCVATYGRYNDRPGSAGKMIPLVQVRIVDDYDRPVPVGKVGEITVKGPMVFKGYWNLPEDTAYAFRDGWHHTGDLGHFDEEGFLFYKGRKPEKELIKPGGENVYPAEVEKVILQHPAVEKTVVFGVPDPKWKEGIKAVCLLKEGQQLDAKDLIEFVGERIARFKKPRYVEFVADFPVLEDGSPDRARIKALHGGSL